MPVLFMSIIYKGALRTDLPCTGQSRCVTLTTQKIFLRSGRILTDRERARKNEIAMGGQLIFGP